MSYAPYPAYKESGVPWLGRVPEAWEVKPLKYVSTFNDEALPEATDPELMLNYVDISSVSLVEGIKKIEQVEFEKAPSRARRVVREGDTIVSTVRTYLKAIAPIRNPIDNMIVSTGFAVIRPNQTMNPDFLGYFIQSEGFVGEVVSKSTGVSYPAINPGDLVAIFGVRPPVEEQTAIADFLDKKTAEIDDLIAKKEELLRLLAEQRTALITHAVTKGLNPNAPMKPSGIDWLGDVPEGWEVDKLSRRTTSIVTGTTPPSGGVDYFENGDIDWFSPSDFSDVQLELRDAKKKVRAEVFHETGQRLFPAGSVLLVGIGATLGKVGWSSIPCTSNQQINAICPDRSLEGPFLAYFLLAIREFVRLSSNASTLAILNQEKTGRLDVLVPPLEEQGTILSEIAAQEKKYQEASERVLSAIKYLKEYRTALITNAVTGKIKVA